jgi:hypothetical protein
MMSIAGAALGFLYLALGVASVIAILVKYKHKEYIYSSFGVMTALLLVAALFIPKDKTATVAETEKKQEALTAEYKQILEKPAPKPETKKEYIASTTKIGGKKAPIYYKEFFKNPSKFEGQRVNLPGKIMVIEETSGKTAIQMQVTGNFDSVIVHYDGTVPVYEGDWIMVYGEGSGVQEGFNRMGAAMTWPVINAKYIIKRASAEES